MTQRRVPARDIIFQVEDSTPGNWLGIKGLNNVNFNLAENEEKTDTTEYDSQGEYEELVMQRGKSATLEGNIYKDHLTGAQDPGQKRCEDLAALKGHDSLGAVRFRHPAEATWKVWPTATFSLGEQGGGNNDMTTWGCTVTKSGQSTTAAV